MLFDILQETNNLIMALINLETKINYLQLILYNMYKKRPTCRSKASPETEFLLNELNCFIIQTLDNSY